MRVLSMPKKYCSAIFIKMNNPKSPKLSNASSSKQMGNQETSFPPFYKTAENHDKHMCRSKLLKFHLNQVVLFGQGSSQSEILGENMLLLCKSCHHGGSFDVKKIMFKNSSSKWTISSPQNSLMCPIQNRWEIKQPHFHPFTNFKTAENQDKHAQIQALEI